MTASFAGHDSPYASLPACVAGAICFGLHLFHRFAQGTVTAEFEERYRALFHIAEARQHPGDWVVVTADGLHTQRYAGLPAPDGRPFVHALAINVDVPLPCFLCGDELATGDNACLIGPLATEPLAAAACMDCFCDAIFQHGEAFLRPLPAFDAEGKPLPPAT